MMARWQFYVLSVVALLHYGLAVVDASDAPAPSLERLQRAPLIRCVIHERPGGQRREVTFTDPTQLERIRAWIQQYAWPPIDLRTTGNVMPRGHFAVFDRADAAKPAFVVSVFGVTTRAEPQITHVTNENWQRFLSLIPPK